MRNPISSHIIVETLELIHTIILAVRSFRVTAVASSSAVLIASFGHSPLFTKGCLQDISSVDFPFLAIIGVTKAVGTQCSVPQCRWPLLCGPSSKIAIIPEYRPDTVISGIHSKATGVVLLFLRVVFYIAHFPTATHLLTRILSILILSTNRMQPFLAFSFPPFLLPHSRLHPDFSCGNHIWQRWRNNQPQDPNVGEAPL